MCTIGESMKVGGVGDSVAQEVLGSELWVTTGHLTIPLLIVNKGSTVRIQIVALTLSPCLGEGECLKAYWAHIQRRAIDLDCVVINTRIGKESPHY